MKLSPTQHITRDGIIKRNPDSIKKRFIHLANEIWQSPLINKIDFTVVVRDSETFMSLAYPHAPVAVGDILYKVPKSMRLYVSKDALMLPDTVFDDILRHEVVHIGYQYHNESFRRFALKRNIPLTFSHASGGGFLVQVQLKPRGRYKTYKSFTNIEDMNECARELSSSGRFRGVRTLY